MGNPTPVRARLAAIAASRAHTRQAWISRFLALAVMVTASAVIADAAAAVREGRLALARPLTPTQRAIQPQKPQVPIVAWIGKDVDGDGAPDFVNPTGKSPRTTDAYGHGHFGASRDGGSRRHEGVDWVAEAGQDVLAPISGYVTRIGYAYGGDMALKYVEIANPALRYKARVFYVDPQVRVGQSVRLGDKIGTLHSLQGAYPGGMTDHVHVELTDPRGRLTDSTRVIAAHVIGYRPAA